jgi:acetoin utilization deacetylase AcuC-like enzyme
VNADRSLLVHSLLAALGLLAGPGVVVEDARPASIEELRQYHHSPDYLAALAKYHLLTPRELARYGLDHDCPPFPGVWEGARLCAGGSLQAAAALAARRCRVAVHLDGGRHHARRDFAAGFCYVNDCVLATLRLLGSFRRVLYLDIDAHHGDAVEEAFQSTDRVLSLSLHHRSPGFFPGSGALGAGGSGAGKGFALNLPLSQGLGDDMFERAFAAAAGGAVDAFRPEAVVLQW